MPPGYNKRMLQRLQKLPRHLGMYLDPVRDDYLMNAGALSDRRLPKWEYCHSE